MKAGVAMSKGWMTAAALGMVAGIAGAQSGRVVSGADTGSTGATYLPQPSFDTTSINPAADPCNDFYKFACGKYAANHPIPADQGLRTGFIRCSM